MYKMDLILNGEQWLSRKTKLNQTKSEKNIKNKRNKFRSKIEIGN